MLLNAILVGIWWQFDAKVIADGQQLKTQDVSFPYAARNAAFLNVVYSSPIALTVHLQPIRRPRRML
jgi:hypothetical protein